MNNKDDHIITTPAFLVEADSYALGCKKVELFLNRTDLIKYDNVSFARDHSFPATDPNFWPLVETVLKQNHQSVIDLIGELRHNHVQQITDLATMKQGYLSKTLHTLVHLLDGFIGADTSFYNLIEDSHQISHELRGSIEEQPEQYRLLQVETENLRALL